VLQRCWASLSPAPVPKARSVPQEVVADGVHPPSAAPAGFAVRPRLDVLTRSGLRCGQLPWIHAPRARPPRQPIPARPGGVAQLGAAPITVVSSALKSAPRNGQAGAAQIFLVRQRKKLSVHVDRSREIFSP
jgi:hypothetical protein